MIDVSPRLFKIQLWNPPQNGKDGNYFQILAILANNAFISHVHPGVRH